MIESRVAALFIGKPVRFRGDAEMSTIGARSLASGPVQLRWSGFEGDQVGEPSVHGGIDKAVHYYPGEHYSPWRADFTKAGRDPHPLLERLGGFGENISGIGMTEDLVCIGDRFRIGTALVEISQGRQPCWKIDHHFGVKGMTAGVTKTGRSGYYLRVLEQGVVAQGDTIQQVGRMEHGWTVERVFHILIGGLHRMEGMDAALKELAKMEVLAASWRRRALQLLD